MRWKTLLHVYLAFVFAVSTFAFADHDHDRGDHDHGRGHGRHGHHEDYREARYSYDDHARHEMRAYYHDNYRHLPPGLAKRDRLPPGLERRLRRHYVLDSEMREYMRPCPVELERRLPPPPPHCAHTIIGGHIVLVNSNTNMVLDIFHVER
jgi:hypothetical protein